MIEPFLFESDDEEEEEKIKDIPVEEIKNERDPEVMVDLSEIKAISLTGDEDMSTNIEEAEQTLTLTGKECLYHECFTFRKDLLNSGEDISHIPEPSLNMPEETLASLHKLYAYAYKSISSSSITKDGVTALSSAVSNIFDGTYQVGSWYPNFGGWSDDIQCRLVTDPGFKETIKRCSVSLQNPWLSLGLQLGLSALSYGKNAKKGDTLNYDINKAYREMHYL